MKAVILNDTSQENHHGCNRVMDNLYSKLSEHNIDVSAIGFLRDDLDSPTLKDSTNSCDFAIINGEGTIHHNNLYAENLLKLVANSTARKKILLNTTYDSNPAHYNAYLRNFDHIFVRDQQSKAELTSCGIASSVVPDLTFLDKPDSVDSRSSGVCAIDSVDRDTLIHLFVLRRTIRNLRPLSIFGRHENLLQHLYEIRRSVALKDIFAPSFVTRTISARRWFSSQTFENHSEFSKEIAQCEFLISGRYHAVCMAIKNRTPFLAIESNTFKISALLEDVGLRSRCLGKADFLKAESLPMSPLSHSEVELMQKYDIDAQQRINEMFEIIFEHG